jgi:hypothetical protein
MALLLDGRKLSLDAPFTHNGFSYPANWLRLTTQADKDALGIVEVPDLVESWDQRFFWGVDQEGMLIAKDHDQLKKQWAQTVKETAGQMLAQTDWMVIRQMDTGVEMPQKVKDLRLAVRNAANEKEQSLLDTLDTLSLSEVVGASGFFMWPEMPKQEPVVEEVMVEEPVAEQEAVMAEEPVAEEAAPEEPVLEESAPEEEQL